MEMKNKLFCHHKSKFSLLLKRFSLTCIGVVSVIAAVTVPTYISMLEDSKAVAQETSENLNANKHENTSEESEQEDTNSEENILDNE